MDLILFFFYTIVLLSILHGTFSVISKIILKLYGYKVNYFVTKFSYETKILKVLCKERKSLKLILITYYLVTILFLAVVVLFILLVIADYLGVFNIPHLCVE